MEFEIKNYEILTNKNIEETKIVTLSDLNWNQSTTLNDMKDLIVYINDILPKYVFILGNVCTYNNLINPEFNEKLTYFFKLLSCVSKSFIVFGNHDYLLDEKTKGYYTNIDNLLNYYNKAIPYYINNYITENDNFNIVGFNKSHLSYYNIDEARSELLNLIKKIKSSLDNDKFNILITHYELNHLRLEKELLDTFDLILTGTNHKTVKKTFFNLNQTQKNDIVLSDKIYIKTGGVSKGEIGCVKIKKI